VYLNNDPPLPTAANLLVQRDSCLESGSFFSVADTTKILSVSWNFGDPTTGSSNTATGFNVSHVFSCVGTFTVTATLTTACGNRILTVPANLIRCSQRPSAIRLV
jgi:PKD repeat protein